MRPNLELHPTPPRDHSGASWTLIAVAVAILVIGAAVFVHFQPGTHLDFGAFYFASHQLIHEGGARLYDFHVQQQYQEHYHTDPRAYFYYPPIALLPFLPLSLLGINAAYITWTIISVVLLVISITLLDRCCPVLPLGVAISAALLFSPVIWCLIHGQTSMIALALYVLAFRLMIFHQHFEAGVLLALLLFKFQLVLPFLFCLLLARQWRVLAGFAVGAFAVFLACFAMVGSHGFEQYLHAVSAMRHATPSIYPAQMASYRGLAYLFLGSDAPLVWIALLGLITCVFAAAAWHRDWQLGFAAAIVASVLAGYHVNPQDLSVVLLSLFVAAQFFSRRTNIVMLVLSSPLALVLLLKGYGALIAFPLLVLLFALGTLRDARSPSPYSDIALTNSRRTRRLM